jgi:hypothetical protein
MKLRELDCLKAGVLGVALLITAVPANAQNTSKGEIKKSGSEAKKAGTSLGSNVRHGRVVRGSKHFGKHVGSAGKHFGRSTKKAFKKIF